MNNLKRVLSLALSGIMLVGMMAVGASAAEFTDAEDIQYDDAVNILVALSVVNGKEDGSYFDPQGDVSRSEMAKMIAVAMNGGNDANTGTKGIPSFTDIDGHWAESYIEYCHDLGIIAGRGDGTFDPEGKVTGLEATKMVLTALGYDAEAYKLIGASWAVRTDELARQASPSLYEELGGVSMYLNATREVAAQIIWNGLQNLTRKVYPSTNTNTGEVTWIYQDGSNTLLKERYDADIEYGIYVGNYNTNGASGIMKGEIAVQAIDGDGNLTNNVRSVPSDMSIDNIGEEVKVIYKNAKNSSDAPDRQDLIYGVFNTGKTQVVHATKADIASASSQPDAADKFKVGGVEYTLATRESGNLLVEENYDAAQRTNATATGTTELKNALFALRTEQNGDTIKFVFDNDGKLTSAYVVETKIAAVTAVNSSKITLNNSVGTVTIANGDVEADLEKGDVVTATVLYNAKASDDSAYVIVKKAESVTGEVSGYKDGENVKVDGTTYKILEKTTMLNAIPDESDVITSFNTGDNKYIEEDVTLYMVNGFVGAAVQNSESASNYSLVTEVKPTATAGSTFSGLQLQVMDSEGVKTIITVSNDSKDVRVSNTTNTGSGSQGDPITSTHTSNAGYKKIIDQYDYRVGDIVTYTLNKSNEAEVTVENMVSYAAAAYSSDDTKFDTVQTATDAVIFVQTADIGDMAADDNLLFSGASYKAYNIRDLKGFAASDVSNGKSAVVKDGKVVAAFANLAQGKNPAGATTNTIYGIVSAADGRVKDYFSYEVQANGETYTVNSKDGSLKKGDLVFFDKANDDNYADDSNNPNQGKGDVKVLTTSYDANSVKAEGAYTKELEEGKAITFFSALGGAAGEFVGIGQQTYALDDNVQIIYVDQDADTSEGESTVGAFDTVTGYMNALIVTEEYENDAKVTTERVLAIIVETSNECNVSNSTAGVVVVSSSDNELSGDEVKAMGDGVFMPAAGTSAASGSFSGSYGDFTKLVFFNFTTKDAENYTLTIKKGTTEVYVETMAGLSASTAYTVYVDTMAAVGKDSGQTGEWKTTDLQNAGTFSYEIKGAGGTVVLSGSFTK